LGDDAVDPGLDLAARLQVALSHPPLPRAMRQLYAATQCPTHEGGARIDLELTAIFVSLPSVLLTLLQLTSSSSIIDMDVAAQRAVLDEVPLPTACPLVITSTSRDPYLNLAFEE